MRRELILLLVIQRAISVFLFGVEVRTGRAEYLQGEEPLLIIRNRGPYTVSFGSYYWLERHRDGEWVGIPFKEYVAFPAWERVLDIEADFSRWVTTAQPMRSTASFNNCMACNIGTFE